MRVRTGALLIVISTDPPPPTPATSTRYDTLEQEFTRRLQECPQTQSGEGGNAYRDTLYLCVAVECCVLVFGFWFSSKGSRGQYCAMRYLAFSLVVHTSTGIDYTISQDCEAFNPSSCASPACVDRWKILRSRGSGAGAKQGKVDNITPQCHPLAGRYIPTESTGGRTLWRSTPALQGRCPRLFRGRPCARTAWRRFSWRCWEKKGVTGHSW